MQPRRSFYPHNNLRRRSGQALLLTVVLMVLAALLGSAFVTLVAQHSGQSARSADKDESVRAAEAGLRFIDGKLGEEGLHWRPKNETPPPQPSQTYEFRLYFQPFDVAQGWATNGVAPAAGEAYHRDGFVKYPDPRTFSNTDNALHFMAKVETVRAGDIDNSAGEKTSALRVTVIGRSARETSAFTRRVAYKGGAAQHSIGGAMRTVTNWDFRAATVPTGEVASYLPGVIELKNVRGAFPLFGHCYVMIGGPHSFSQNGIAPRHAVVRSYNPASKMLTLAADVTPAPIPGERVEMAAALGGPRYINYDNGTSISTTTELAEFSISNGALPTTGQVTAGGVRVNGGLLWQGDVRAENLRSTTANSNNVAAGAIRVSGVMQIAPAATPTPSAPTSAGPTAVNIGGVYRDRNGIEKTLAPSLLTSSADAGFPGAWTGLNADEKAQLVDDGWNRLSGVIGQTRQTSHFVPPDIMRDGAARYRRLTQFSRPAAGGEGNAALYGYGEGIYINNPTDRERVSSGGRLVDMNADQFWQMLFGAASTTNFYRSGNPAPLSDTSRSLEEQHLRGWIGPDEFRARGALIELNADATLTVTLDSRDDGAHAAGAAPGKSWRDANGALMGGSAGGVYTQTFAWPKTGVLFAEGNVRIRGTAINPPRSLTIVSMNNIFIDGTTKIHNTDGATRKLLLLARKNVVLNPTAVLSRLDAQTRLRAATVAGSNQIEVCDADGFRPGDWIYIDVPATTNEPYGCIQAIDYARDIITLDRAVSAQAALLPVRAESDPLTSSTPSVVPNKYTVISRFSQTMQRRFSLPGTGAAEVRLALKHSGERRGHKTPANRDRLAFAMPYYDATTGGTAASGVNLGVKLAANAQTSVLRSVDKFITTVDAASQPLDTIGIATLGASEKASLYNLRWLGGDPPSTPAVRGVVRAARNAPNWYYAVNADEVVESDYLLSPTAAPQIPPYYFLASVGNRKTYMTSATKPNSTAWPWREKLMPDAGAPATGWGNAGYQVPLATSVALQLNGRYSFDAGIDGLLGIRNDTFNSAMNDYERVGQFGFNPQHGAVAGSVWNAEPEDILTTDQNFYTTGWATGQTLDSRTVRGANGGVNSFAVRLNNQNVDGVALDRFFNDNTSVSIPYYRLWRTKFENGDQLGAARTFEKLAPGYTIEVNAFVYAQEGSWLVVPGDYFDEDIANQATSTSATAFSRNDLDRNGILSAGERAAGYRFCRYNYQIRFTGAIAENHTAIIHTSGTVPGAVADWMDKWSTISLNATNFASDGKLLTNIKYDRDRTRSSFANIAYTFDDSVARGLLDEDDGFRLPVESGYLSVN